MSQSLLLRLHLAAAGYGERKIQIPASRAHCCSWHPRVVYRGGWQVPYIVRETYRQSLPGRRQRREPRHLPVLQDEHPAVDLAHRKTVGAGLCKGKRKRKERVNFCFRRRAEQGGDLKVFGGISLLPPPSLVPPEWRRRGRLASTEGGIEIISRLPARRRRRRKWWKWLAMPA